VPQKGYAPRFPFLDSCLAGRIDLYVNTRRKSMLGSRKGGYFASNPSMTRTIKDAQFSCLRKSTGWFPVLGPMGQRASDAPAYAPISKTLSQQNSSRSVGTHSRPRNEQIGRLDPVEDEVWDLRSQKPKPALRAFFRFAEKDILVVLTCSPRSVPVSWLSRLPLLGRETREWRRAIVECRSEWRKLFLAHEPISGTDINAYLTGAIL